MRSAASGMFGDYRVRGNLRSSQVRSIIQAYWQEIVEAYTQAGLHEPKGVKRIEVVEDWHDTCRHFAGMTLDSQTLIVAPEIVGPSVPVEMVQAILAHEAGHAVDLARPGELFFRRPPLRLGRIQEKVIPSQWRPREDGRALIAVSKETITPAVKKAWYARPGDEKEQVADAVAETVLNRRIGYVGPCLVQTFDKGRPRPDGLR